jgi:hypothetical protein
MEHTPEEEDEADAAGAGGEKDGTAEAEQDDEDATSMPTEAGTTRQNCEATSWERERKGVFCTSSISNALRAALACELSHRLGKGSADLKGGEDDEDDAEEADGREDEGTAEDEVDEENRGIEGSLFTRAEFGCAWVRAGVYAWV